MKRLYFLAAAFLALSFAVPPMGLQSHAESFALDGTTIEGDLKDTDLSGYQKDESEKAEIVLFQEYGFAADVLNSEFAVYVYLYTPAAQVLSEEKGANVLNMAVSYDGTGEPATYSNVPLSVLDHTEDNLFYKFKISDSGMQERVRSYAKNYGVRRYDLAGIQLRRKGAQSADSMRDLPLGTSYKFSGYAAGFGFGTESTLECKADYLDTVKLDVTYTYYREKNLNQNGANHVNQINSVYFAVPKAKLGDYSGKLYAVTCEWDERRTSPVIVTNRQEVYDEIIKGIGTTGKGGKYAIYDNFSPANGYHPPSATWAFNPDSDVQRELFGEEIPLGYAFKRSEESILSARVSANEMKKWISDRNYADYLFTDDVDTGRTYGKQTHTFTADTPFDLLTFNATASGWDKFAQGWREFWSFGKADTDWGGENGSIDPIKYLQDSDFQGVDTVNSEKLYINAEDYGSFKAYYDENKKKNDVYLLRFAVTDYYSALQSVSDKDKLIQNPEEESTYMARETVFLDFDIIYLDFWYENAPHKILAAVSDPIDAIGGIDPPPVIDNSWWRYALIAIVALAAVGIVAAIVERREE